jgi:hypothetical protein
MPSLRGAASTGHPLPLYRLGAGALKGKAPLSRARKIGWYVPVIGGAVPGLAILRARAKGPEYAGLIEGPLAQRLLDAALFVEGDLADAEAVFEPRLLQIPSLQALLLWMQRPGKSLFVALAEARQAPDLELEDDLREIAARAKKRRRRSRRGAKA